MILSSCLMFLSLWLFCCLWLVPPGPGSTRSQRRIGWMAWQLTPDEFTWRDSLDQWLILRYPAAQRLIKRDQKLCTNTQRCSKDMGIFLSGDTNNCFLFSWSRHWSNEQWDRENFPPIANQGLWWKVAEDVAFGFSKHRMGNSTCEESSSTDGQQKLLCHQVGIQQLQSGRRNDLLIYRHLRTSSEFCTGLLKVLLVPFSY